jgi:TonB family protein
VSRCFSACRSEVQVFATGKNKAGTIFAMNKQNRRFLKGWYGVLFGFIIAPIFGVGPTFGESQNSGGLEQLVTAYHAASYLESPNVARQITRALRKTPKTNETASLRARALVALSSQAAVEDRKGLALANAREALVLMNSEPANSPLRAQAAIAVARAELLHEDYLPALTSITAARRAYGVRRDQNDAMWENLLLWEAIVQSQLPQRLSEQAKTLSLSDEERVRLDIEQRAQCVGGEGDFRRDRAYGVEPNYPIASMFDGRTGGVVLRLNVDANGKVTQAVSTAFVPRPGFAAAAEIAAMTWQLKFPANTPSACLQDVPMVVSFQLR